MGRILSQDEIDALLGSSPSSEATSRVPGGHDAIVTYDFRRPDRASREQIRSLHVLHDRFARNMSTSLSAYLRAVTEVTIVSVEQFTYSEFLMSLPDPTAYYSLTLQPMEGIGALELNPSVAFTMIDRMLGGKRAASLHNPRADGDRAERRRRRREAGAREPQRDVGHDCVRFASRRRHEKRGLRCFKWPRRTIR